MRLYYFIHLTGRDPGNSGIQRVVRNLGAALQARGDIDLIPVRWCARQRAIVHAEYPFLERIALYSGPQFRPGDREGAPIHLDPRPQGETGGPWLLMAEVPHLASADPSYPWVHASFVLGYARRHGLRSAFVFHDILPLSHFGKACTDDPEALRFVAYANALGRADVILPVSRASAGELNNWFAENGIAESPGRVVQPVLLPEEMTVADAGQYLDTREAAGVVEFCMWGSILPHKNQVAVLEAFNRLGRRRPGLRLVLHVFGHMGGSIARRVGEAARRSNGRIRLHGFVDDQTMASIIARCRASIFLSLAEGYGLPLAESLWLGKPCITSNLAPMTEIAAGGGCLLADPSDEEDIIHAIELLATSPETLANLKEELADRPMRRWRDYAGQVVALLAGCAVSPRPEIVAPRHVARRPIPRNAVEIMPAWLHIHEAYKEGDGAILRDNAIRYERDRHGRIAEATLSFGPYIDLLPARYELRFSGLLRGELEISLTANAGRQKIGNRRMRDDLESMKFSALKKMTGFEIVIRKTNETDYLKIDGITLEEFAI